MKVVMAFFLVSVSLVSCSNSHSDDTQQQLDTTCGILADSLTMDMTPVERTQYVEGELEAAEVDKAILEAFDAIFLLAPADRAEIFKASLSELVEGDWDCEAVDQVFPAGSE